MDRFAMFWKAYPRRTAKGNAEKAWRKIKPGQELTGHILDSIERHKHSDQWQKEGGRFIPHPATWLNGKRWEDEPETAGVDPQSVNALHGRPESTAPSHSLDELPF